MSELDYHDGGAGDLTADQRDALNQLHARITHDIAEAHLTGDKARVEQVVEYRRVVSDRLSGGVSAGDAASDSAAADLHDYDRADHNDRNDREDLEDRRAELTRDLHEAVANKDSRRAGRLDRERGDLTEELYGNGDIVGAGGRSL